MRQDAILKLGHDALAQLARQLGLRGAWVFDAERLRLALGAYLSQVPPEPSRDEGDEPDGGQGASARGAPDRAGLAVEDLPPALKTETMARLLETQGKQVEARALREGLRRHRQDGTSAPANPLDGLALGQPARAPTVTQGREAPATIALEVDERQIRLRWRLGPVPPDPSSKEGTWQIELWIWRARGSRITRKVAPTEPEGEHLLERPPDAAFAAAVLGLRQGGTLRSRARSALWRAPSLTAPMAPCGQSEGSPTSGPSAADSP